MYDIPVEVKKVLKKGRGLKRYRFEVYADDAASDYEFTIGNDNLVAESVKIDERMCSSNVIKFGLCEGSSLEFQYFGFDNINGKTIKAFLDVQYKNEGALTWYSIPMGFYTVDQCPMQFSTGIFKVTAYNKLKSSYLDAKANALIDDAFSDSVFNTVTFYDIRRLLLSDYEIDYAEERVKQIPSIYYGSGRKCGNTLKLAAKYGIESPLNWYMLSLPDPSVALMNLYPFSIANEMEFDLDSDKSYRILSADIMADYELGVYNTIKDIISLSTNTNGQTFVNNMMNSYSYTSGGETVTYNGWYDFCGVILTKENNQTEIFSDIAYDNHLSGVKGRYSDLNYSTLKGYKKIKINIPVYLELNTSQTFDGYLTQYEFTVPSSAVPSGGHEYLWYTDDDLQFARRSRYMFKYYNTDVPVVYDDIKDLIQAFKLNLSDADLIEVNPLTLADITLREALSAVYEISACYGKLDRVTNIFAPVELNQGGLHPQEGLYPAIGLHPNGNTGGKAIHPFPAEYQKLWTDSVGMQNFRYLRITYKTLDSNNNEIEKVLQRTVNTHGTTDYNMSSNWLFLNLIWDPEDVGDYADAMVEKMRDISWFPFEMWAAGLPYIETGDAIEITDREDNTYTSYILQRQLNGIHNLQDTFINGELDVF